MWGETQGPWLEGGFGRAGLRDLTFTFQALAEKPLLLLGDTILRHASLGQLWLHRRGCMLAQGTGLEQL